ncbi:MAG: radical SAM family heme chaperone HemW [Pseudobdellovibrionaceae bacterium]|nr:radical SAM family heme chaperone HemW [Bdellovibrionales bacterium]USN46880.1 MAG: radical SAM family heme chaperone HemW [Pseudobdellovibrionaceae bacterium]
MSFGIYVHIPYCVQRCHYCDFATFTREQAPPMSQYLQWILTEIRSRHGGIPKSTVTSIYFGGGTPSLFPPEYILSIVSELANVGFRFDHEIEITIEINPATITEETLDIYKKGGVNRYSVGAQSFNDRLLESCGRIHSADDTRNTLQLLTDNHLNFSFDLLFALPGQSLEDLRVDLNEVALFSPPHLSTYCLTVPSGHPMSKGRPLEDHQIQMFAEIESHLGQIGLHKYEISNFSKPGQQSRHNWLYWTNQPYWGIGLSAHSYLPHSGNGVRFWNPPTFHGYQAQISCDIDEWGYMCLPENQYEELSEREAAIDYCYTHLRTSHGIAESTLLGRFSQALIDPVFQQLQQLQQEGLVIYKPDSGHWRLTPQGEMVNNQVLSQIVMAI